MAEVLESHVSYPMLALFRSQHPGQSWVTALGLVTDAAERLFSDLATPDVVNAAEAGAWPSELWDAVTEAGFLDALGGDAGGALDALVVSTGVAVAVVAPPIAAVIEQGTNLSGEPRDDIALDLKLDARSVAGAPMGADAGVVYRLGALFRAAQMAGALEISSPIKCPAE